MGLRFRKSFKVAPGVKVNIGKKSTGVSIGGKYGGVSLNTRSGARARVSAPGTGISYSTKIGRTAKNKSSSNHNSARSFDSDMKYINSLSKEEKYKHIATKNNLTQSSANTYKIVFTLIAIIAFLIAIPTAAIGSVGIIFIIIGAIASYYAILYGKIKRYIKNNPNYTQSFEPSGNEYINSLYKDMYNDVVNYETHNIASSTYFSGINEIEASFTQKTLDYLKQEDII